MRHLIVPQEIACTILEMSGRIRQLEMQVEALQMLLDRVEEVVEEGEQAQAQD